MTDQTAAARLVAKLGSLELEADEAALLRAVFRRAAEAGGPEVEGFGIGLASDPLGGAFRVDGTSTTKPFKGTDEELQAIIDWLGTLEAQK